MSWVRESYPSSREDVLAEVPQWALQAGMPSPFQGESVSAYAERIGMSRRRQQALWAHLNDRRLWCLANRRLVTYLTEQLPREWEAYKDARYRAARA